MVDEAGNAVSMTHSLGMPSGVISPGLGFMYNGCMGVFDPRPGGADRSRPAKGFLCPSILFRDGALLVIGAPGGTQVAVGVLQAILNVIDFDMSMVEAVSAPRFSATSNLIDVSNRISRQTTRPLEAAGYTVVRSAQTFGFAAVHGIKIDNGTWQGGATPAMMGSPSRVTAPRLKGDIDGLHPRPALAMECLRFGRGDPRRRRQRRRGGRRGDRPRAGGKSAPQRDCRV